MTDSSSWESTDVGTVVGYFYKIVKQIGSGGQAQVFQAIDMRGGPDVAIKVLRDAHANEADFRERFSREAKILQALKSPATLRVIQESFLEDGRPALVTELLTGRSLGEQLDLLSQRNAHIPPAGLLALMGPVSVALDEAHRVGVIHRDIKPDNLFLLNEEREGTRVKLLDFGFAKFLNLSALTAQGSIAGSPRYIAPEGWLGERDLTPAFDVYSLGAVVYHCLVGQPPFSEERLARLLPLVTSAARPSITDSRPDLAPAMNDWVARSLAIKREERFAGVVEQFEALKAALG